MRTLRLLLALAVLGFANSVSAQVYRPETFTLANGLEVVVVDNPRVPAVAVMLWYRIGSADEPLGKGGIAHFLEHLMFKGTPATGPGEYARVIGREGGSQNAMTSYDYTGYWAEVASDRLEMVLKLEADRMINLELTEEQVLSERDVILAERSQVVDNRPSSQLGEQTRALLYQHYPYRLPVIGWRHEIEKLTREDALAWYRRYYAPNNAILVVSGDVDVARLKPLAEKHFGPIPARVIPARWRPSEPPQRVARRLTMKSEQAGTASLSRMYQAPSYIYGDTAQAYALQVLAELFGGSTTSRLYRDMVVDQTLATSAGAYYEASTIGPGSFGFYASPRQGKTVEDVEAALDMAIERLLADGPTEDEVARAKQRLAAAAAFARDSLRGPATALGAALVIGRKIEDVEAWPRRIEAVTRDAVIAAARAVIKPEASVTSIMLPKPTS
ncbi:MAG: insulinase family protein [Alphaproteobacteria bacterium]|nr:insulinase family protein [Alphaproteobacteria bacterium]